MSRKLLIMTAAAGVVSFAGAFGLSRFMKPAGQSEQAQAGQPVEAGEQLGTMFAQQQGRPGGAGTQGREQAAQPQQMLSERQLKSLVFEVRERIRQYNDKLKDLKVREQHLVTAQETLRKDIDELDNLRVEVASAVAKLKEQRDALAASRTEIAKNEKTNLISIAATYDKMDPVSASKIMTNMCTTQMQNGRIQGGSFDDAVKILHYMTERTKAKLLAELVTTEPKLAAVLCQRLKQVVEQQ